MSTSSNATLTGNLSTLSIDGWLRSILQIAGVMPDLRFSGEFQAWMNIDGTLPDLQFDGEFGRELILDNPNLPSLGFAGTGWFTMPTGTLPALDFTGEVKHQNDGDIDGTLPVLGFAGTFGAQPSGEWLLPTLEFSGQLDGNNCTLAGTLPALVRPDGFVYHDRQDANIAGTLPALTFSGVLWRQVEGDISGNLPALTGDIEMIAVSDVGGNMDGKLPTLSISGSITGDNRFDLAGTLPPLSAPASGSIGSGGPEVGTPDVTVTGDEVIRFRRG